MFQKSALNTAWLKLPDQPGVYFFKDAHGSLLYVGKATSLKKRVASYAKPNHNDWKTHALIEDAQDIEFRALATPLEALILEAELIQAHQPKFNILLKSGQPFLYFLFTATNPPELLLMRSQNRKGVYVGPFVHRGQARQIYEIIVRAFGLRLCHKKIDGGCMYFHIGQCPGSCRPDFDLKAYNIRLNLAKKLLQQGAKGIISELETQIATHNQNLEFERSKQLSFQIEQIKTTGLSIETTRSSSSNSMPEEQKHIWLLWPEGQALELFIASKGIVQKLELWFAPDGIIDNAADYMRTYYTNFPCPNSVFTNFLVSESATVEAFLTEWHNKLQTVAIIDRIDATPPDFVLLAQAMQTTEFEAFQNNPQKIASLVGAQTSVHTIDCFDISHKQGRFMVGACVRFVDGHPDKNNFRRFKIQTVAHQDDYACLREVVARRYKNATEDLPDLILIDGGKGQRSAVENLVGTTPLAALAKKEERLFCTKNLNEGVRLDSKSLHGALLIALRDYTHHFAITYHRKLFEAGIDT